MASRAQVSSAASRLLEALLADEALVTWIAEEEIARRIAAGDLIPAEALRQVPGMELVPMGIVAELRECLHDLAHHPKVASLDGIEPLVERCRIAAIPYAEYALLNAPAEPEAQPEPAADPPAEEAAAPVPPPETTSDAAQPDDDRPPGMPPGMPNGPVYCEDCGTLLASLEKYPDEHPPASVPCHDDCIVQAQFSWTRFRVPLCRPCTGARTPTRRRAA